MQLGCDFQEQRRLCCSVHARLVGLFLLTCGVCCDVRQCNVGYIEQVPPTTSADRVCIPCPFGFKSYAGLGNCTAWSTCTAGQFQVAPTISTDRICTNDTVCGANQFQTQAPTTYSGA